MADLPQNADLFSFVITLSPQSTPDMPLPRWWGEAARALLLRVVDAGDAGMAKKCHEENEQRPFTVSTLMGAFPSRAFAPDGVYRLRFTSLTCELTQLLWQAVQPGGPLRIGASVELEYLSFTVKEVAWLPEQHPLAGYDSYQALMARWLLVTDLPASILGIEFFSPTFFADSLRLHLRELPFPLPAQVFGSLLRRWNQFCSSLAFPEEVRRYANECMAIRSFELRSRMAYIKNNPQIGMTGKVTYKSVNYDRYWLALLGALSQYAFYSGVGAKTASGLGMARLSTKKPVAAEH